MTSLRLGAIAAPLACLLVVSTLWAQEATVSRAHGFPQDWSDRSIVFSLKGLVQHPELLYQEPRIRHQLMQRFPIANPVRLREEDIVPVSNTSSGDLRDWEQSLGKSHVSANMFPAKYTFNLTASPSCTNDFVVFGLSTAGAKGGQANLVAFNNLYAGAGGYCTTGPSVLFAYNVTTQTGGKVVTSPVLSEDGTKIAFVESLATASVFHVVTVGTGGTVTGAVDPTTMTSVTYSTANTTTSSPWVDYTSDVAYIADDTGVLYKIANVFTGTPTVVHTSPWPVTVASGTHLTGPVYDRSRSALMAGGHDGNLYEIDSTSGAVSALIVGAHNQTNPGILANPIVDVSDGTTFVVSANNGSSAVLVEADTTTLTRLASAPIGLGSFGGATVNIYQPAFNNAYYSEASSGTIYTCGTGSGDTTPWEYTFGFTGRVMQTTPSFSQQLLTSTTAMCTPWTEFFNPSIGANGTDFFFFGLNSDCVDATEGCVASITGTSNTPTFAVVPGGPSGIIIDNYSTVGQASSIYLSAEGADDAYKFTQQGLN